jgi:hypothetical protein
MILASKIFSCLPFEASSVAPWTSSFLCFQIASEAEIPEVPNEGWSEVCHGIDIMEVPEGVILVVYLEPCGGDSTA